MWTFRTPKSSTEMDKNTSNKQTDYFTKNVDFEDSSWVQQIDDIASDFTKKMWIFFAAAAQEMDENVQIISQ